MTLQQLNYAITIAETGSMNRAAEKLYIAQPSLSASMQELEKELGISIFNRGGRGVTLTPEGQEFILYANQVYGQYRNLLEKFGKGGNVSGTTVNAGASATFYGSGGGLGAYSSSNFQTYNGGDGAGYQGVCYIRVPA